MSVLEIKFNILICVDDEKFSKQHVDEMLLEKNCYVFKEIENVEKTEAFKFMQVPDKVLEEFKFRGFLIVEQTKQYLT